MRIKRVFGLGAVSILLSAMFVMPVSAHGHHRQTQAAAVTNAVCTVCTVEDCTQAGLHIHNDTTYCGYAHESGYCDGSCGAIGVCYVEGCAETGYHSHNQTTYCGYDHGCGYCDGSCGAIGVCYVEGCTQTGHHSHDYGTYCGYNHASGYCDGSCVPVTTGGSQGRGGHHGRGRHGCW